MTSPSSCRTACADITLLMWCTVGFGCVSLIPVAVETSSLLVKNALPLSDSTTVQCCPAPSVLIWNSSPATNPGPLSSYCDLSVQPVPRLPTPLVITGCPHGRFAGAALALIAPVVSVMAPTARTTARIRIRIGDPSFEVNRPSPTNTHRGYTGFSL